MNSIPVILITETPRDAMQGWPHYIPAEVKAKYINALLKVGFDTIDCGSFVSAKAIPQMADTAEVIKLLDVSNTNTKLMVIAGNTRGCLKAAAEKKVQTIAYPYSVSGTFLKRNLNTTPENAWKTILELKNICDHSEKKMRVYLAMAFGNPYGDACYDEIVICEVERLIKTGIHDLVFSDITGEGTPESVERLCTDLVTQFPDIQPGIHLHTKPNDWLSKVEAAWRSGIQRFEGALGGYGGCPMTGYELVANLNTFNLIDWCNQMQIHTGLNMEAMREAEHISFEVFV